jgi:hypothetical protein
VTNIPETDPVPEADPVAVETPEGVDEAVAQPATEMTIAACRMEESFIVALAVWWRCRRR